jgi:predicted TIM-barrel fold metal-dependent hydrolase
MLDLDIVDAHHHLCDLSHSYPWLEGAAKPFRYHGDDRPLRRSYSLADYLADFEPLRLVGSVHIENGAADPQWEAEWIDSLTRESSIPSAQVTKVDLASPDAPARIEAFAALPSVRGVRDILNWHPDPRFTHRARSDLMTDAAWLRGFAALADNGLSFDLQVFPAQLPEAAPLAARHPGTRVILDHAGMPIGRDPESIRQWRAGMAALAAQENVVTKISALGTNDHGWAVDSLRPFVLDTIEIFGPDRCMFGSNFPVDSLYSTLAELYDAFDTITTGFSDGERRSLFGATASRTYRLESDPARPASVRAGSTDRPGEPGRVTQPGEPVA